MKRSIKRVNPTSETQIAERLFYPSSPSRQDDKVLMRREELLDTGGLYCHVYQKHNGIESKHYYQGSLESLQTASDRDHALIQEVREKLLSTLDCFTPESPYPRTSIVHGYSKSLGILVSKENTPVKQVITSLSYWPIYRSPYSECEFRLGEYQRDHERDRRWSRLDLIEEYRWILIAGNDTVSIGNEPIQLMLDKVITLSQQWRK